MTIKGVSEIRRFPRIGKIRLGIKAVNKAGVEYPKAVDYFVCPPEVQAIYGEKPVELRIVFPVEDVTKFAPQSYSCYAATRGLICRGDGENALRLIDKKTGALAQRESLETEMRFWRCHPVQENAEDSQDLCPEWTGEGYKAPQCRRLMQLQFFLPDVPGLGVWQLDTGSFHNIVSLNSVVDILRAMTSPPRISMVPLRMLLVPREGQVEGKKKTFHVLQFIVPYSLTELQALMSKPPLQAIIGAPDEPEPMLTGEEDAGEPPTSPGTEAPPAPPIASPGDPSPTPPRGENQGVGTGPEGSHTWPDFHDEMEVRGIPSGKVKEILGVKTPKEAEALGLTPWTARLKVLRAMGIATELQAEKLF